MSSREETAKYLSRVLKYLSRVCGNDILRKTENGRTSDFNEATLNHKTVNNRQ